MDKIKKKENEVGNQLSDFEIIKELGKGSYGTVYKVKSLLNSNVYVMKKMEIKHLKHQQQLECYREVSILKKVSHQNIIQYYSSFLEEEILYLIMEYAELGDLYSLIKHYKKHSKYFDEIDIWKISLEILSGLEYLHSRKIIHRDIKCLNLFITKDRHVKIGDLGVSTITSSIDNLHYTRVGTPLYLSPELVKQKPYDYKTDIWSFGCSLYHLVSLEPPFIGNNLIALGNNIVKGIPKSLPQQYSNELKAFIDKLLEKRPENRPSAKEAIDMIPKDIKEKIKTNGVKFYIKSKRPFSSAMNKITAVNKEEIKNIFSDDIKKEIKNEQNNLDKKIDIFNKKVYNYNDKTSKKNMNHILNNNHSSGNFITVHNLDNNNFKNIINNEKKNLNKNEIKINENKKREFQSLFNHDNKEKIIHRNNDNFISDLKSVKDNNYLNINSYKELEKSRNISIYPPSSPKKQFDLSFNIPSFNNQKGFNIFRVRNKYSEKSLLQNKYTLADRLNSNNNYSCLKIFSPILNNNYFCDIKKLKKHNFSQKNVIEPNKNKNINNLQNKNNTENNLNENFGKNIKKEKYKEISHITESNINFNKDINNINDININNTNTNNNNINQKNEINKKYNGNITFENGQNEQLKKNDLENKRDLIRINTEISKKNEKEKEKITFPELNTKEKTINNYMKKSNTNKNIYPFMNQHLTNFPNKANLYKRLTSAHPNSRSFSNNRPFTSKVNKNQNSLRENINFKNDTFSNIIRLNKNIFYTKKIPNSNSPRNFSENKNINSKNETFRPMTGIKPQLNNNIMNININFYNIDMNKRFLIPEINLYNPSLDNGNEKGNDIEQFNEQPFIRNSKIKDNIINNIDLKSYKNANEFLFEKIIKAFKDINDNNKRLTINDLK